MSKFRLLADSKPTKASAVFVLILGFAFFSACSRYSISVNDRQVFVPAPLPEDHLIKDQALSTCVTQTLIDQNIRNPSELEILNCSYAGIRTLDGLSSYSGLRQINLRNNDISNLEELAKLKQLELVNLLDNEDIACEQLSNLFIPGQIQIYSDLQCDN